MEVDKYGPKLSLQQHLYLAWLLTKIRILLRMFVGFCIFVALHSREAVEYLYMSKHQGTEIMICYGSKIGSVPANIYPASASAVPD